MRDDAVVFVERACRYALSIRYADGVDYSGLITLQAASGRPTQIDAEGRIVIVVQHPHAAEDAEYEFMLMKPLGGVVFGPKAYVGKRIVIDELALLQYTISIRYPGGGVGATSQIVNLTANSPSEELVFEMKRPGD